MATRQASKIMSIAEKKEAQKNLKLVQKQNNFLARANSFDIKAAVKVLALAKKAVDGNVKAAAKTVELANKSAAKDLSTAQKQYDSIVAKATRNSAAIEKGAAKIAGQIAALNAAHAAVPLAKVKRAKKQSEEQAETV